MERENSNQPENNCTVTHQSENNKITLSISTLKHPLISTLMGPPAGLKKTYQTTSIF